MDTRIKKVKIHIKKGDIVKVISGNDRERIGEVLAIDKSKYRALVKEINVRTFHIKPTKKSPKGKRERKEAHIHISNLMLIESSTQKATRVGRKLNREGKLQRYAKKTGNFI